MKKYIYVFTAMIILAGCSSDDDQRQSLEGEWNLIRIERGWLAGDSEFDKGVIQWKFNGINRKVSVDNDAVMPADLSSTSGPATGIYNYAVVNGDPGCDGELSIDDRNYGCISYIGDTLRVSTIESDGSAYYLIR